MIIQISIQGTKVTPLPFFSPLALAFCEMMQYFKKTTQETMLLTSAMRRIRIKWALKYKNWTVNEWRKVRFSDESHFLVQGQRSQHIRRSVVEPMSRECHINQSVKHPKKDVQG